MSAATLDHACPISEGKSTMPLVPAKCTNCGSGLDVDSAQAAAICPSCGSAFVVEQAITNYNTTNVTKHEITDSVVTINYAADEFTIVDGVLYDYTGKRKHIFVPDGVTSIGKKVFSGCEDLRSVTLPASVATIGDEAFAYCWLETVEVSPSNTTVFVRDGVLFSDCGARLVLAFSPSSEYAIPDSVTSVDATAFRYCRSLTSVTIPDSVTSIGDDAFYGCESLTSIVIPDSVTSIGDPAFSSCKSLESVTIGSSVTSIGDRFRRCESLESVTIGSSVTSIGDVAFWGCKSLKSVTIPDSVTSIGDDAFYGCESLTSIFIPDSVTSIGERVFSSCESLKSVTIGSSVTSIGERVFSSCESLKSVTIPDSVTSIGDYAFYGCESLKSVTIGSSVTSIGDYAFYGCKSLTSVTIPDSVTSIGESAFSSCSSLGPVDIGYGVTNIQRLTFDPNSQLRFAVPPHLAGHHAFRFHNVRIKATTPAAWHPDSAGIVPVVQPTDQQTGAPVRSAVAPTTGSQRQVGSTRRGCGCAALVVFGLLFMLSVVAAFQACSSDSVSASAYRPGASSDWSGSGGGSTGGYRSSSGYGESAYDCDGDGTLDCDTDAYRDLAGGISFATGTGYAGPDGSLTAVS